MKGKKVVNWTSPKYYQSGWDKFVRSIPGMRKWQCKKLKGNHVFEVKEVSANTWTDKALVTYECKGCGKKKVTFERLENTT